MPQSLIAALTLLLVGACSSATPSPDTPLPHGSEDTATAQDPATPPQDLAPGEDGVPDDSHARETTAPDDTQEDRAGEDTAQDDTDLSDASDPSQDPVHALCACLLGEEAAADRRYTLAGPEITGRLPSSIPEASGMITSRHHPDVFWTHNDSGHRAELYALSEDGTLLATVAFPTLRNRDWEDIARGPCEGDEARDGCLYIGDIGDNRSVYESVLVHRWRELDPRTLPPTLSVEADDVETAELVFPDGARDTEALIVDPQGRLWFLTKRPPTGHFRVYSAPFRPGERTTLTFHHQIPLSRSSLVGRLSMFTAADLHPRCNALIGRYYGGGFLALLDRLDPDAIDEATLHSIPTGSERQGEAIAFTHDGYWHVGEADAAPIYRFRCTPTP